MGVKQWIDEIAKSPERVGVGALVGTVAPERDGLKKETPTGLSVEEYAEYERVAAKVGFAPRGLKSDALLAFLRESGIRVYPTDAVVKYLGEKYGVKKDDPLISGSTVAKWVWKPLRSADGFDRTVRERLMQTGRQIWHSRNGAVAREQHPYAKPVPLPVLLTVERISDKFPEALFFVSDEYSAPPMPDPFLAVVYGEDSSPVIVERWDEPGFRGEKPRSSTVRIHRQ